MSRGYCLNESGKGGMRVCIYGWRWVRPLVWSSFHSFLFMFSGHLPFTARNEEDRMAQIVNWRTTLIFPNVKPISDEVKDVLKRSALLFFVGSAVLVLNSLFQMAVPTLKDLNPCSGPLRLLKALPSFPSMST